MEVVSECNCCGGRNFEPLYRQPDALFHPGEWFDVVRCRACGFGFVNPRPAPEEMDRYYPSVYFSHFAEPEQQARYAREAAIVRRAVVAPRPRLLDVGCAHGDFPRHMRSLGWEVEGVEVSAAAGERHDFPVYRQPLDRIPVAGPRYDAVTAWSVLEHVHQPMAYFRKAGEILRPGGAFVFLVTNLDSLSSRALFREDVPRHLSFFTEASVRRFCEAAGLELERVEHDRSITEMKPANILYYWLYTRFAGRPPRWEDLPAPRFVAFRGRQPGRWEALAYFLRQPLLVADRLAALAYERWQIRHRSYGIVIYTARKPVAAAAARAATG